MILVHLAGSALEVASLYLTVHAIVRNNNDGTFTWDEPKGWKRARGPAHITIGISIGLGGNIASLYVH